MICKKALARTRASVSQIVFLCAIFRKHVLLYTQEQQFFSRKKNLIISRQKSMIWNFLKNPTFSQLNPIVGAALTY